MDRPQPRRGTVSGWYCRLFCGLLLAVACGLRAEDICYPDDAGIVNVKDHGVKGDGVTDDTAALQALFDIHVGKSWAHDRATLYMPNGTYLVSKPLYMAGPLVSLQGQSATGTVIRLADNSPLFQDPDKPVAVFYGYRPSNTNMNMNFGSYLLNVTVDTGKGNPGASGVAICTHNTGGVQDVVIRCGGDRGGFGLDMTQPVQGPGLCRNVRIEGPFRYGILLGPSVTSSTFEDIHIIRPREAGVAVIKHPAAFRLLRYEGTAPAVKELESDVEGGHLVIVDSVFSGGRRDSVAVDLTANRGAAECGDTSVLLRNVEVRGFGVAVKNTDGSTVTPAQVKKEWHTGQVMSVTPQPNATTLNLPIEEVPAMPWEPLSKWVNVMKFGAEKLTPANRRPEDKQDGRWINELGDVHDITTAMQKAIDSGATTVYLPKGLYVVRRPIYLRNKLRVLQGCRSVVFTPGMRAAPSWVADPTPPEPWLILDGPGAPIVWVDQLHAAYKHVGDRTLVIRRAGGSYESVPGAGDLFMDDWCGAPLHFRARQNVWIRQCDSEADYPKVLNHAAQVWILGIKTEGIATDVFTGPGAATEILGGVFYPGMRATVGPSIEVREGRLSASLARFWDRGNFYQETINNVTRTIDTKGGHRMVHLLVSSPR